MSKCLLLTLFFNIFIFKTALFAQDGLLDNRIVQTKKDTKTYAIQSLEGKTVKVKVLPDYVHNILCVIYLRDTIKVFDYWDVTPKTSYLSKQFLKVNYEVRGGSNLGLGHSMIICVSRNKLYEALHVLQYTDWESGELLKKYDVEFALLIRKKNYIINARVNDKSISTNNPETNYQYTNNSQLHFDKKLKIFYSIKQNLYDTLKVSYHDKTFRRKIEGNFPQVLLEDNKYIFIEGQWFELSNDAIIKY
jgi:hypothetical protein